MQIFNVRIVGGMVLTFTLGFLVSYFIVSAQEEGPAPEMQRTPSAKELKDFRKELQDIQRETKNIQKQLKSGGTEEWQKSLSEVHLQVSECAKKIGVAPSDEQRDLIDECRSLGLWNTINEIRDEFVPPQEVKNATNDIKRQLNELRKFKKDFEKLTFADEVNKVDALIQQLTKYKADIEAAKGRDQRDALQDYWNAQLWDEINGFRAKIEAPRELKNVRKEFTGLMKDVARSQTKKAFSFFTVDTAKLNEALKTKLSSLDTMEQNMKEKKFDEAWELLQSEIHEEWHPGDVRHFVNMLTEAHRRLKVLRDKDLQGKFLDVLNPIVETFNNGEYRDARDALVQFSEQMQKYEALFNRYFSRKNVTFDKKLSDAMQRLEDAIGSKLEKGDREDDGRGKDNRPPKPDEGPPEFPGLEDIGL